MDWSTLTGAQWSYIAVIFLGMVLGKALACETRINFGLLIAAVLVPTNFAVAGLAVLLSAMAVKVVFHFTHW